MVPLCGYPQQAIPPVDTDWVHPAPALLRQAGTAECNGVVFPQSSGYFAGCCRLAYAFSSGGNSVTKSLLEMFHTTTPDS